MQICLMHARTQSPIPMKFSGCSKRDLKKYLKTGLGGCLMNKPVKGGWLYNERLCGNNNLDPGEDCDCGYPKYCQNPCCNASTCRYTTGSQCSSGGCCSSSCQLKSAETICRGATDVCDIAETCDGVKSQCPENIYTQDGSKCNEHVEDGYCYQGAFH